MEKGATPWAAPPLQEPGSPQRGASCPRGQLSPAPPCGQREASTEAGSSPSFLAPGPGLETGSCTGEEGTELKTQVS